MTQTTSRLVGAAGPRGTVAAGVALALVGTLGLVVVVNHLWLAAVNPWVLGTTPLSKLHSSNAVIGYSYLLDGAVIHKENLSALFNALAFNGYFVRPDGYFLRPLYPFVVSLLSPLVGLIAAAQLVNHAAYAVLVVATAWLAYRLAVRPVAALLGGALALLGLGPIMHVNDYSAHILGYAFFAVVVVAVVESRVWCEPRPLAVHLALGCLLALAALTHPSGGMLAIGYLVVALPWSRWYAVAVAAGLGIFARTLWEQVLTLSYGRFFHLHGLDLYTLDFGAALRLSLNEWLRHWSMGPLGFLGILARVLGDFVFVAFPPVTLLGLLALLLLNRRSPQRLWCLLVLFALPFGGIVVLSQAAGARGYGGYGATVILYAALVAWLVGRGVPRRWVGTGWATMVVLLVGHGVWGLAHLRGYYFPMVAFFIGSSQAPDPSVWTEVYSLSGGLPTWRLYGGPADFVAAGGLPLGAITAGNAAPRSFLFALVTKAALLAPVFALGWALTCGRAGSARKGAALAAAGAIYEPSGATERTHPDGQRRMPKGLGWTIGWAVLSAVLAGGGFALEREAVAAFAPDQVTPYSGHQMVVQEADVAPAVMDAIRRLAAQRPGAALQVLARAHNVQAAELQLGGRVLPAAHVQGVGVTQIWQVPVVDFLAAAQQGLTLRLRAEIVDGSVGGWQAAPLPGRRSDPAPAYQGVGYTPTLELRLVDASGSTETALLLAY